MIDRRRRWMALGALALAASLTAVPPIRLRLLESAGRLLVCDDSARRGDVVVLPEWAGAAGAIDAADLVRAGMATRVAVLPGPRLPAEQELARRGVPYANDAVRLTALLHALGVANAELVDATAEGTEAEGALLAPWADAGGFGSIIVVASPDHSRRVRRVLRRSMRGHRATVSIRVSRYSPFDPARWWQTREGVRTEIVELEKLALDVLRHPLS